MKKYLRLTAIACGMASLIGGSVQSQANPAPKPNANVQVGKSNNGKAVSLKIGQTLEIALTSNPSTGYEWAVLKNNPKLLAVAGPSTYDPNKTGMAGAPSVQHLRFKGVKVGTVNLELGYRRPWEKNKKPIELWKIKVKIQK